MKSLNVLFLGGAKRVSFAEYLKKSAEEKGFTLCLYSYELEKEVPISIAGEVIIGLRWKDGELYNHLSKLIEEKRIDMVLPFVDPAIAVAAHLKKLFPELYIPCSDLEICETMFDKTTSAEWFESINVPIPKTYIKGKNIFFPLIAKPKGGSASKGIIVIRDEKEYKSFNANNDITKYLLQLYIENGEEYTVDTFVSQEQEIISIVPRIRLEQAGGEAVRSKTLHDEQIENLSRKILETKAFIGPITIQFIRDKVSGETFVMEINPRYGGAVVTSFGASADTTKCLVSEWRKEKVLPINDWKANVLMTRYFIEVIFYADNN